MWEPELLSSSHGASPRPVCSQGISTGCRCSCSVSPSPVDFVPTACVPDENIMMLTILVCVLWIILGPGPDNAFPCKHVMLLHVKLKKALHINTALPGSSVIPLGKDPQSSCWASMASVHPRQEPPLGAWEGGAQQAILPGPEAGSGLKANTETGRGGGGCKG